MSSEILREATQLLEKIASKKLGVSLEVPDGTASLLEHAKSASSGAGVSGEIVGILSAIDTSKSSDSVEDLCCTIEELMSGIDSSSDLYKELSPHVDSLYKSSGFEQLASKLGWDESTGQWRYCVRDPEDFNEDSFYTQTISGGVQAVVGVTKGDKSKIQSMRFSKTAFDDLGSAKDWAAEHEDIIKGMNEKVDSRKSAEVNVSKSMLLEGEDLWGFEQKVRGALRAHAKAGKLLNLPQSEYGNGGYGPYVSGLFDTYLVFDWEGDKYYSVDWSRSGDEFTFGESVTEVSMKVTYQPVSKSCDDAGVNVSKSDIMDGESMDDFRRNLESSLHDCIKDGSVALPQQADRASDFWPYVSSIFDTYLIVEMESSKYYMVIWSRSNDGKFSFDSAAPEVMKRTVYQPVSKGNELEKLDVLLAGHYISKSDDGDEERFVLGGVLEPNDGTDGKLKPDTDKDIYSAEEIRKAAHNWAANGFELGIQHLVKAKSTLIPVESYIAPQDLVVEGVEFKKGTWIMAAKVVDDTLWSMVKKGKMTGWSIEGKAFRTPIDGKGGD